MEKNQGFIKIPLIKNCGYIKRFVSEKKTLTKMFIKTLNPKIN